MLSTSDMQKKSQITIFIIIMFLSSCESFGRQYELITIKRPEGVVQVGVLNPHGIFIYLYSDEFHCPGTTVEPENVVIDPNKALGYYWDNGNRREIVVFDKKGVYEIFVSNNLETDLSEISGARIKYENHSSRVPDSIKGCTV